jgi:hypothetical protein
MQLDLGIGNTLVAVGRAVIVGQGGRRLGTVSTGGASWEHDLWNT